MFNKNWEIFVVEGKTFTINAEPLEDYFNKGNKKPFTDYLNAACLRGYIGTWELINNVLYLTKIQPFGDTDPQLNLQTIFPNHHRVFANWYSGEFKTYSGEFLLPFKDPTDEPLFEFEIHYRFQNGLLLQKTVYKHATIKEERDDFLSNPFTTEIIETITNKMPY